MMTFLSYLLESTLGKDDFTKHNGKYVQNVIADIIKTGYVLIGQTADDAVKVKVDANIISALKNIDIKTLTQQDLNSLFATNSTPFRWGGTKNAIFKSNLYKGSNRSDAEADSAEMESVICLAFNTMNNTLNADEIALANGDMELSEATNSTASKKVYNFYIANKDKIDACAKPLFSIATKNDRFDKLGNETEVSDIWLKLGKYDQLGNKPNKTAKTDIISSSGKCKISLKKELGARLMSGKQSEAIATIRTALYRTFGSKEVKNGKSTKWTPELIAFEKLIDKKWIELHSKFGIRELKQLDKKIKSGKIDFSEVNQQAKEAIQLIAKGEKAIEKVRDTLINLCKTNKKFKNNLLYEAITGRCKFSGEYLANNETKIKSVANYVLVWDIDKPEMNKLYTIQDYIDHLMQKDLDIQLTFKSANGFSYISLQILT